MAKSQTVERRYNNLEITEHTIIKLSHDVSFYVMKKIKGRGANYLALHTCDCGNVNSSSIVFAEVNHKGLLRIINDKEKIEELRRIMAKQETI